MKIYLDKLKAKPEASRRRYALTFSLLLTLAIGGGWLMNLRHSLSGGLIAKESAVQEQTGGLITLAEVPVSEPSARLRVGQAWERVKLGFKTVQDLTANVFRK